MIRTPQRSDSVENKQEFTIVQNGDIAHFEKNEIDEGGTDKKESDEVYQQDQII